MPNIENQFLMLFAQSSNNELKTKLKVSYTTINKMREAISKEDFDYILKNISAETLLAITDKK